MHAIDLNAMNEAVAAVKAVWPEAKPELGLILGSGWGDAVADFPIKASMPYDDIPNLGKTGVAGHAGKLILSEVNGKELLIFQGRRHWYEGEGWTPVVLPVWILKQLGASAVLLTNASGGIRNDLGPGALMVMSDHINMLGSNPLIGPHRAELGLRFPDQTEVYVATLRKKLLEAGADSEGVYVAATGPTFETPAEIRAFRAMGADAVGMSTVPEAIVANALGLQVAGLSCVCNWAAGLGHDELTHEDVSRAAAEAMPRMKKVITQFAEAFYEGIE
jgi:purine-nucleoside phosphorylase